MKLLKKIVFKILKFFSYPESFPIYYLPDGGMGSHVKYIEHILKKISKNCLVTIVEVGSGHNSTGLFYKYRKLLNLNVFSYENNFRWYKEMKKNYSCKEIVINFAENSYTETINSSLGLNTDVDLVFIDSSPWDTRTEATNLFKNRAKIVCVHDVDWFPHNNKWGEETSPIKFEKKNKLFYGKIKEKNLGKRNYDDMFKYWVEVFPVNPGYYTGPPLLIGSNVYDVNKLFEDDKPKGIYLNN